MASAIAQFESIGLSDLHDSALFERVDRKFVAPASLIPALLSGALREYRALEIDGQRVFHYVTQYYDTADLALYHAHHAGRRPRSKVRVREYRVTGDRYLELKQRTNTGTTIKTRQRLNGHRELPLATLRDTSTIAVPELDRELHETVQVSYDRMTLVHRTRPERVTVDLNLILAAGGRRVQYPTLAFVEVKQAHREPSGIVSALRGHGVRARDISKYCLGVVNLVAGARTTRFRRRFAQLNRIGGANERAG